MIEPSRVVLFANGELPNPVYARAQINESDTIIVANGGSRLAFALNIVPDLLIGDSDSLPAEILQWIIDNHVPSRRHPAEKDETDLELAIHYAITLQPKRILFLGLTGDRTDHMLANFSLLAQVAASHIQAEVIVDQEHIYAVTEEIALSGTAGERVSLLPWGGDVRGVTTDGLKWPLWGENLLFGAARGISNVMTGASARIQLAEGLLLVIHERGRRHT